MKRVLLICVLLSIVTFLPTTTAARADELKKQTIAFDGDERAVFIHLPPSYDEATPLPLVLVLHGGGGGGKQIAKQTGFSEVADREGFIAVFPDGTKTGPNEHFWNAGNPDAADDPEKASLTVDDVAFTAALLDMLEERLAIDPDRIYVTGFSNGAGLTHLIACGLSERIAAAAAVSSGLSRACDPTAPVSIMQMIGSEDPHFAGEGTIDVDGVPATIRHALDVWSAFNECPTPPVVETGDRVTTETFGPCAEGTEVIGMTLAGVGHNWPGGPKGAGDPIDATEVIWDFFARHARAGSDAAD